MIKNSYCFNYAEVISYNKKNLERCFRTRVDNRAMRNGGRKKFNGNLIDI